MATDQKNRGEKLQHNINTERATIFSIIMR